MKYYVMALMLLLLGAETYAQTRIKVQEPIQNIPRIKSLDSELRAYELFHMQVEQVNALLVEEAAAPTITLELSEQLPLELILEPVNLKTKDYQVTIHTPEGYQSPKNNPVFAYKGFLKSDPNSKVRLTVTEEQFSGVVQNYQGDNLHFKTLAGPAGQPLLVTYKDTDLLQPTTHQCGSPEPKSDNNQGNKSSGLTAECVLTEIYLIADAAAVDAFGGSPATAEANMLEVLNLVNSHYEPVGVKYEVAGIFISTDPNGPWPVRNQADDQLDAAIDWFNDQNFPGDVFTFWSSPDWDYSYAYVGAICRYYGGNLCAAWGGLTANTLNSNTQAHELGHNFNAGHDATGIMRSTVSNQPSSFSANSISVMTSYIPSVETVCLDECVDDCSNFIADAGPDVIICAGSSTQLQASGGTTYSWSPETGLDNPNIANPIANPASTIIYTATISNSSGCLAEAQVTVNVQDLPMADAGPDQVLSCNSNSITLDGVGSSSGIEYTYLWTTSDGNIVSGNNSLNPTVDASGTYTLEVTDQDTGCQSYDQVEVTNDSSLPTADAGEDQALTCAVAAVDLDGSNSSQGANYTYLWTTSNGNIISGVDGDQITVDAPGTYMLTVTETGSNCTSFDQVQVTQNIETPVADAGADKILGCDANSLTVGGSNTSTGNQYSYSWSTADGSFSGGTQSANAEVNAAGTYELLVTNNVTGCVNTDLVEVIKDTTVPVVTAGGDQILSCQDNQMVLDGTGSATGAQISYLWTTSNGNILSGETTLMPVIGQPGDYTLTVVNEVTGCENSDMATVTLSAVPPIADAGTDQQLTCSDATVTLDGSGSTSGGNISLLWTTINGNIVSGASTTAPVVDRAGNYLLTVTDTGTGCESTDEVEVTSNVEVPRADAGRDLTIGCTANTVELRGDNSSAGPQYAYSWATTSGNMLSGQNTPVVTVDAPGTYTLTVTNTNTGCSNRDDAIVILDNTLPVVDAGSDQMINCQRPEVALNGSNSEQGNEIRYRWTTSDGNIVSGASSQTALVDLAGTYILTVTNTSSGCTQSDEVVVNGNTLAPQADAGTNKTLNCQNPTAIIGGNSAQSSQVGEATYQWTTNDGNIVSGANTPQATVDSEGTYTLMVTNVANNCVAQDQVTVTGSSVPPTVEAGDDIVIAAGEEVQLQAVSNRDVSFEWSPREAVDNPNIFNPRVITDRTITLTVTVTDGNNCASQDRITLIVPAAEDLKIPNSFSPNGDGVNDTWNIPGIEFLGPYTVEIFNRTGNTVHRGNAISWDGTYKGNVLPTGTYFYVFNFTNQGSLAGHVNIIK